MGRGRRAAVAVVLALVTESTARSSKKVQTASARCPKDKKVISGGARIVGGKNEVRLTALVPRESANAYEARAAEDADGYQGDWRLEVYALCAVPLIGLHYVRNSDDDVFKGRGSSSAVCKEGQAVLGGGAEATRSGDPDDTVAVQLHVLLDSYSGPKTDAVAVNSRGDRPAYDETVAHAVCADPVGRLTSEHEVEVLDEGTTQSVTVKCPEGLTLLGVFAYIDPGHSNFGVVMDSGHGLSALWADPSLRSATFTGNRLEDSSELWGLSGGAVCGNALA
jgi:hypothetical protein